ncbi:hypothetical protein ACQWHR_26340, partial [Salmonella enterica subsp. enterica serovar Infantis]
SCPIYKYAIFAAQSDYIFIGNSARKGTNHGALKINILQQIARWRFCAYRAGVYAPLAGWIRRSHHPAAICR